MNIEKVYGKKTITDLEQEYEDLSLIELVKMNFTLKAHTQAVVQLIKKKKEVKLKLLIIPMKKERRSNSG